MLNKLLGTKIGMSQMFDENKNVIPVTVINAGEWFVLQIKTAENDGYCALQLGLPRDRYKGRPFAHAFLGKKSKYFAFIREVPLEELNVASYAIGQMLTIKDFNLAPNDAVNVAGTSIGVGFQGGVKRYGFAGGPSAHGSTFHRKPGSVGAMRTQGNVIKGKRLPGQCGGNRVTVRNLKVVKVDQETNCLFIRGAVPGKTNSLLYIRKQV